VGVFKYLVEEREGRRERERKRGGERGGRERKEEHQPRSRGGPWPAAGESFFFFWRAELLVQQEV
jgi:hypothetical protein